MYYIILLCGPGYSSRYSDSLRAGRSGDRIPLGTRFFAEVQTGPGAHSASYIMGTGSLIPGVKRPGRGVDHPPSSSSRVKERVDLYIPLLPLWAFMARSRVKFIILYYIILYYIILYYIILHYIILYYISLYILA
jgi:hypothetical protein